MNIINHILIPIDFSNSAMSAIQYAIGMSKGDRKIKYTLLNVSSDKNQLTEVEYKLDQIASDLFEPFGIPCEVLVTTGLLADNIIQLKEKLKVDLIIMGTGGSENTNNKTHTVEILEKVNCPVWIIPENTHGFQLRNIAMALDENEWDSPAGLRFFHDIAKWYNAKVHLLKIDTENQIQGPASLKKESTMEYYLDNLDYHYSFPKNSDIEDGINTYVLAHQIDTLAIIPRIHAVHNPPSKGKLTKVLALHSKIPLLVID
ncbi:universal stress protein [Reichenbachiella agarivorans]|uniref:Universal stress protein n=1 Tax=Reichenbachiella agarivorans TaxID=2979464 RepID=A0ABY6CKN6_9BACT|nr:universal stress protein [Reichenbachiella agarivorans]UXP30964.1 universal stress protein [Reichenbachiella agarivorans]